MTLGNLRPVSSQVLVFNPKVSIETSDIRLPPPFINLKTEALEGRGLLWGLPGEELGGGAVTPSSPLHFGVWARVSLLGLFRGLCRSFHVVLVLESSSCPPLPLSPGPGRAGPFLLSFPKCLRWRQSEENFQKGNCLG